MVVFPDNENKFTYVKMSTCGICAYLHTCTHTYLPDSWFLFKKILIQTEVVEVDWQVIIKSASSYNKKTALLDSKDSFEGPVWISRVYVHTYIKHIYMLYIAYIRSTHIIIDKNIHLFIKYKLSKYIYNIIYIFIVH